MLATSSPRFQPAASVATASQRAAQQLAASKLSREDVMDELAAMFQRIHRPGKDLISASRAYQAAALLVNALQEDHLNITSPGPTLSGLLKENADAILPVLERLCRSETGHGIRSVSLDSGLTAKLYSKQPTSLHTGLKALMNLQELSLQPWEGELDLLYFPLVKTIALDMREADAKMQLNVLAWKGTNVFAVWDQRPEHTSTVHLLAPGRPAQKTPIQVVLAKPAFPLLLTGKTSTLSAAKPRLTTNFPRKAPQSILAFMKNEAPAPSQQNGETPDRTVVLAANDETNIACWLKVCALGQIEVALMYAPDSGEASQLFYRVNADIDSFSTELAGLLKLDEVLPLAQLLDELALFSVNVVAFHSWLEARFEMVPIER